MSQFRDKMLQPSYPPSYPPSTAEDRQPQELRYRIQDAHEVPRVMQQGVGRGRGRRGRGGPPDRSYRGTPIYFNGRDPLSPPRRRENSPLSRSASGRYESEYAEAERVSPMRRRSPSPNERHWSPTSDARTLVRPGWNEPDYGHVASSSLPTSYSARNPTASTPLNGSTKPSLLMRMKSPPPLAPPAPPASAPPPKRRRVDSVPQLDAESGARTPPRTAALTPPRSAPTSTSTRTPVAAPVPIILPPIRITASTLNFTAPNPTRTNPSPPIQVKPERTTPPPPLFSRNAPVRNGNPTSGVLHIPMPQSCQRRPGIPQDALDRLRTEWSQAEQAKIRAEGKIVEKCFIRFVISERLL